jgi:hypothetical protein
LSERSLFSDEPAERRHHVTGRGSNDGCYLDPELIAPLTHSEHELVHDDWHTLGIDEQREPQIFLDSLELRLERSACFIGRLSEEWPGPIGTFLALLAACLARLAARLSDSLDALDGYCPGWRAAPGV